MRDFSIMLATLDFLQKKPRRGNRGSTYGLQKGVTEGWRITVVQPRGSESFNQGQHSEE